MSTAVPDAWDECAACGHDREDHGLAACTVRLADIFGLKNRQCPCNGFGETA